MSVGGGHPPETIKVKCISKGTASVHFTGHEVTPDNGKVSLLLCGDPQYFEEGKEYAIIFKPID